MAQAKRETSSVDVIGTSLIIPGADGSDERILVAGASYGWGLASAGDLCERFAYPWSSIALEHVYMRYLVVAGLVSVMCGAVFAMEESSGTFEVTMEPQEEAPGAGVSIGRAMLKKQYKGGLEGKATGQMLTAVSQVPTSAAYVAAEQFEGSLDGKTGSFALTHRGVMSQGEQDLSIDIVPDSGTGELLGIRGSMTIERRDGQHVYVLTYTLAN